MTQPHLTSVICSSCVWGIPLAIATTLFLGATLYAKNLEALADDILDLRASIDPSSAERFQILHPRYSEVIPIQVTECLRIFAICNRNPREASTFVRGIRHEMQVFLPTAF